MSQLGSRMPNLELCVERLETQEEELRQSQPRRESAELSERGPEAATCRSKSDTK